MSTPTFDELGNLTPYEVMEMSLDAFEAHFVIAFPESTTRKPIFDAYRQCLTQLQGLIGGGFTQWVDGSFVTRKLNPRDLDLVTFLEIDRYERAQVPLDELRWGRIKKNSLTDGYFLFVRPEGHPYRSTYESDRADWFRHFKWGRNHRPKGWIELKF
jgi:hypothetical protein